MMRKFIKINGKEYKPAEMSFDNICRMEEMGASLTDSDKMQFSLLRGYVALCTRKSKEAAGKELEAHVLNGGSLTDLSEALAEAVDESGFFQTLSKTAEEETGEMESKPKK